MKRPLEPYQPFFLSGLLISILGLGIWIAFQERLISFYPNESHAFLMVMGFLFAYINGFLMTAVPKMSQTEAASSLEIMVGLVMLWVQVPLAFLASPSLSYSWAVIQILFLAYFVGRRFFMRRANPPKAFFFLPFGLLSAAAGAALLANSELAGDWHVYGKNLLFQAFVLNLILGLGSRLVPALTRVQGALDVRSSQAESSLVYLIPAVLLNVAFAAEVFFDSPMGSLLKIAVMVWMAVKHLKIFKPLQVRGFLGVGIRISIGFLILGYLLAFLFPDYGLHLQHLSFIGGFALLTFLISTRVVLAHGGYNLNLEIQSSKLLWFWMFALTIGLMRVVLGFEAQYRSLLLWVLFLSWVALCALWSSSFGRKLLKLEKPA